MIQPVDVAHVNLNVTDLDRAIRFYTELLGFKIAFLYEDAVAWLNFGQYRDDVKGSVTAFTICPLQGGQLGARGPKEARGDESHGSAAPLS